MLDYIVVGSDSGRVVILEYDPSKNAFNKVHQETYGKSGCRRIVPGQYLAADPRGRAFMIAAVEKQKLVYILNRDSAARLTISSPLEAHKSHAILFDVVGVDVGFENPLFACLELDYEDADNDPSGEAAANAPKQLVYYELDLGLNHVVRKWSEPVDKRSNMLIPVPGGQDGTGGVLVCAENMIVWKSEGHPETRVPIPRRINPLEDKSRGLLLTRYAMHRTKTMFFFLAQSETGDLYRITLDYEKDVVRNIRIKYFDTVPTASALFVMRAGFLFVGAEFGNHFLYQIQALGDEDDEREFTSADWDPENSLVYFKPRDLKNLTVVDEMDSLNPIMDSKVLYWTHDDSPHFYTLCGRGSQSSLRVLRHGLEVSEMAVSELPGNPAAIWSVKLRAEDKHDAYIVVSFLNATLVLSIGETVEEVTNAGFLLSVATLHVAHLGEDTLVQVYADGVRHIRADKRVSEWKAPAKRPIVRATSNARQVVVALAGGELVYFELDEFAQLNEYQERKEMTSEVVALGLGPVPAGRQRCRFVAVACADNTVRVLSLDPNDCLEQVGLQAVQVSAQSLCIQEMQLSPGETMPRLVLCIGLLNGVLLRAALDPQSGHIGDTRLRFLGARPVKLFPVSILAGPAVLALSSKPWLSYQFQARNNLTPLTYEALEFASNFSSAQCPEGIVAIAGNTLRIIAVEKLGIVFNQTKAPLKYTPRKFVVHPIARTLFVIESENRTYSSKEQFKLLAEKGIHLTNGASHAGGDSMDVDGHSGNAPKAAEPELPPVAGATGHWASCLRVLDPMGSQTLALQEFEDNEAAVSLSTCLFHDHAGELYLAVGSAKNLLLSPRTCSVGYITVYRFTKEGHDLELVHKTQVEEVPYALCAFQGRLLAGIGKTLRIYDLGRKKLLRKCENKLFPNFIVSLHTQGDRIVLGDIQESFHYVKYKHAENTLVTFADDTVPRWLTAQCMLDYDTMAGADKFGNFFVDRLPSAISEDVDDDPTGNKIVFEKGFLNGAPYKLEHAVEYHLGETITSINRAVLVPGGSEVIVYTTLSGGMGAFIPFSSREDVDLFQHLEMHLRTEDPPICGRHHLMFRSFYHPVKVNSPVLRFRLNVLLTWCLVLH